MDMNIQLRPLIVVTGTIHVEGGDKSKVQTRVRQVKDKVKKNGAPRKTTERLTVVHERIVHRHRRQANVVATDYARKMRGIRIIKTPFGHLIERSRLKDFKALSVALAKDVVKFNRSHDGAQLYNGLLWEVLGGKRLDSVRGWLLMKSRKDDGVRKALPTLRAAA